MKKNVKYSDLVLNTLLDTIKRENRYTIDNVDIMNYEDVIRQIIKYNGLDITIEDINSRSEFLDVISKYTVMSQVENKQLYTLLPWINEIELERDLENTIFSTGDMQIVSEFTMEHLRFSRDCSEKYILDKKSRDVAHSYYESIRLNIRLLETETFMQKEKLQKVKSRIGR